ncbi:MBL fold metallo-hydrolase [Microbulbifer sp. VAAF005]|uniref:MBL fold metallo-hydrolase n=1 Tax=Microbulbifer sp. VAAF005 TaxID=3034230 RepID=UPI0024ACDA03|nr:MBL fold metallo-hydrolase [Microbulbifer sp. VAAF005]WHI45648.1 MBL fold metallo-hydrolase [Microbulbifer sp. VAAF005]
MKNVVGSVALAVSVLAASFTSAQDRFANVEISSEAVSGNVYMLKGAGGNIAVLVGEDGTFMVDDQYAPLTAKIQQAVAELAKQPLRFVINTHWHGDHTGGNENLGKSGALIVAHENVRKRVSTEQFIEAFKRKVEPSPPEALPVITFTDATTFYWNGDRVKVQHVGPAHTDGDSIVHFAEADVIHMGDIYFNGNYPFIDLSSGGSVDGMIAAMDTALAMAGEDTKIIPGHGPLSNRAELQQQRNILAGLRDKVKAMVDEGKTRQEVISAKPTAEFDSQYGQGFMTPDIWTGIVYDSLTQS